MNHPFLRTSLEQLPEEAFIGDGISFRPIRTDADLAYAIFDCQLNEEHVSRIAYWNLHRYLSQFV